MKLGYAKLGSFYLSMKKKQSLEKKFNNNHTYTKRKKTKQSSSLWMKKWCNLPFFCFFHSHPYSWGFSISGNDKYRNPCKKVFFCSLCSWQLNKYMYLLESGEQKVFVCFFFALLEDIRWGTMFKKKSFSNQTMGCFRKAENQILICCWKNMKKTWASLGLWKVFVQSVSLCMAFFHKI